MEESVAMPRITRDQVVFFLEQFRGGGAKNSDYRKRLVEVFVNAVYVYDDKIVITYNYSGEHNTATLEEIDAAIDGCGDICSGNGSDNVHYAPPKQDDPKHFYLSGVLGII